MDESCCARQAFLTSKSDVKLQLTDDRLAITMSREILGRLHQGSRSSTLLAVTVGHAGRFPYVLAVVVERRVAGMVAASVRCVMKGAEPRAALVGALRGTATNDGSIEPFVVSRVHRGGRVSILWRTIARVRWRQRSGLVPLVVVAPVTTIGSRRRRLVTLQARQPLVLGNLLLVPGGIGKLVARPGHFSIDGRDERGKAFPAGLGLVSLLGLQPLLPVSQPSLVVLALVQVDVKTPVDGAQPLVFQGVELLHSDAAHFRPRLVLEGVVVEELAAEKKRDGKHPPDLTFGVVVLSGSM